MSTSPLERLVSRVLHLGLSPGIDPAAIVTAAVDAVVGAARAGEAPNRVAITVSPEDAGELAPIIDDLRAAVTEGLSRAAAAASLRPFGPWLVTIQPSSWHEPGAFAVDAAFVDPAAPVLPSRTRQTVHLRRLNGLALRIDGVGFVPLAYTPFVLGRGQGCDAVIPDLSVSRRHAEIRHRPDGGLGLCDLGSRNGTFLRGERVQCAPIEPGDTFRLAAVPITLEELR